jgi:hypothetical protein
MAAKKRKRLKDAYRFDGFRPEEFVHGIFGDSHARIVVLIRRSKKLSAACAERFAPAGTTAGGGGSAIFPAARCGFFSSSKYGGFSAVAVGM